ncbi:MAG: MmcQ/YjbR family DNA-binding protein [Verrucomicrobiales bacterium]
MDAESLREYFLAKPSVTEETPCGPDVLVYKVAGKMFATFGFEIEDGEESPRTNLKCDPERAIELRADYEAILPGYHMNKKHWNTVLIEQLPTLLVRELVDHSWELVVAGLPKKLRESISDAT